MLEFSSVTDQASVAGIQIHGKIAPSFKIQSFLQNDSAADAAHSKHPALDCRLDNNDS